MDDLSPRSSESESGEGDVHPCSQKPLEPTDDSPTIGIRNEDTSDSSVEEVLPIPEEQPITDDSLFELRVLKDNETAVLAFNECETRAQQLFALDTGIKPSHRSGELWQQLLAQSEALHAANKARQGALQALKRLNKTSNSAFRNIISDKLENIELLEHIYRPVLKTTSGIGGEAESSDAESTQSLASHVPSIEPISEAGGELLCGICGGLSKTPSPLESTTTANNANISITKAVSSMGWGSHLFYSSVILICMFLAFAFCLLWLASAEEVSVMRHFPGCAYRPGYLAAAPF